MLKKTTCALVAATLASTMVPAQAFGLSQRAYRSVFAGLSDTGIVRQAPASTLDITEAGTYVLCGNMRGTVRVTPGAGEVTLVLAGATIDGNGAPAIEAISGDALRIQMPAGQTNRLMSSGTQGGRGTIHSAVDTVFEGAGQTTIVSDQQSAFTADNANMTFYDGSFDVISGTNGMKAEGTQPGSIRMEGGNFSFHVGDEMVAPGSDFRNVGASVQDMGFSQDLSYGTYEQNNSWSSQPAQEMWQGGMGQATAGTPLSGQQMGQPGQQMGQPNQQMGQPNQQMGQPGQQMGLVGTTNTVGTIVEGTTTNSAAELSPDLEGATTYDVTENGIVKIDASGTYIVTGTNEDGSITVAKNTEDVVLVLDNLDLTSTSGATLSVNKGAEVQIVVKNTVSLTDAEDIANEESDDFDGAAIKAKANSNVYITGDGTLNINGTAKNGIKGGDESSIIIDGKDLDINIDAANDGINSNYDMTIVSGTVTIKAEDDAIHADHILTIGDVTTGDGPTINVEKSTEGLEATVVNIHGGNVNIVSSDDAINAANADALYEGELDYSVNVTGGKINTTSGGDGIDSNGNVNLVDGSAQIKSGNAGGEAGIDYDGNLYVSEDFQLNNNSGVAGPDGMGGQPGQFGEGQQMDTMPSDMGGQQMGSQPAQFGDAPQGMGGQPGQFGEGQQMGTMPSDMGGGQQMGTMPTDMGGGQQMGTMPTDMGGAPSGQPGAMPSDMGGQPGSNQQTGGAPSEMGGQPGQFGEGQQMGTIPAGMSNQPGASQQMGTMPTDMGGGQQMGTMPSDMGGQPGSNQQTGGAPSEMGGQPGQFGEGQQMGAMPSDMGGQQMGTMPADMGGQFGPGQQMGSQPAQFGGDQQMSGRNMFFF